MKKIEYGIKDSNKEYYFRETCFGIVEIDNNFYFTKKKNEISMIGGGIEENETHNECLKREFLEEAGLEIINAKHFITIDCYWTTNNGNNMNSLANFYIVKINKSNMTLPTENDCELYIINKKDSVSLLELPYQIKALEMYLKENNQ